MFGFKHSIKRQYALIFGLLLFGSILFISVFNMLTLNKFYTIHKQRTLLSAYTDLKSLAGQKDINSRAFDQEIIQYSSVYNISILILDSEANLVKATNQDANILAKRLLDYIFNGADDAKVVYDKDGVRVQLITEERVNLDFLELWGRLDKEHYILMRCAVQSLNEATRFSNQILIGVGLIISIVGIIIILIISNKLTMPIMKLVSISNKMTQLDFSEKYDCNGEENEIDVLGHHINILSSKLEETILELKNANIELQKDIDRRDALDEMRKDFVSNVSHELKTPIALVQGYAEGLKDCVNDDEESKEFYCDVIIDEAGKMNKLVRNLLDLHELEYGHNNVDMEHFDIVELIYNCVSAFDLLIKNDNIKLELPDRNTRVLVWADEFKVENILNNYVSNAIHHASGDRIVRISIDKHNEFERIIVYNSGDNIPEDVIDKLWTKFYKVDKARTREYGGSGIGLSIVKASMDAMGHDYGVINREDGVEFWFEVDNNEKAK